jgi:hypothetical protein
MLVFTSVNASDDADRRASAQPAREGIRLPIIKKLEMKQVNNVAKLQ